MTTDLTPSTADNLAETYEPEPIVIPVRDILDGVVGPLARVELGAIGGQKYAWSGVDREGRVLSGTMRPRFEVDAANSITIDWEVEVDDGQ